MSGEESREEWLKWCLDFIARDLKSLGDVDKIKLAAEASQLTNTWIVSDELLGGPRKEHNLEELSAAHPLRGGRTHEELIESLKGINLEKLQTCAREFFRPLLDLVGGLLLVGQQLKEPPSSLQIVPPMPIGISVGYNLPGLQRFPHGLKDATISISFIAGSHEQAFLFQVSRLLEGVRLDIFRKCKECSKWFIHAGAREKLFCTNRCAARHGIRERRRMNKEEGEHVDPEEREKELRANAERAHEYYVKKHRSQGKSGKPARRPYKYKED